MIRLIENNLKLIKNPFKKLRVVKVTKKLVFLINCNLLSLSVKEK